jgi:hypothetical protein
MATFAHERVIDLIEDLPNETLPDLLRFIEFLRFKSSQDQRTAPTEAEAPLLAIALRRLPSADQHRLSLLRAREEEGALTPEEHVELLTFVDRIEQQDAERAAALLELSRLRSVPIRTLMSELGLEPGANAH